MGVATETPTEVVQTGIERYQAGLPVTGPEANREYLEAGLGGAIAGGTLGGATRAAFGARPEVAPPAEPAAPAAPAPAPAPAPVKKERKKRVAKTVAPVLEQPPVKPKAIESSEPALLVNDEDVITINVRKFEHNGKFYFLNSAKDKLYTIGTDGQPFHYHGRYNRDTETIDTEFGDSDAEY
jgi:hypothetical protein